jgi:hypothetical protein
MHGSPERVDERGLVDAAHVGQDEARRWVALSCVLDELRAAHSVPLQVDARDALAGA